MDGDEVGCSDPGWLADQHGLSNDFECMLTTLFFSF